jgi:hypothetical protein
MIEFARSKTVGVQAQGDDQWTAHGRLDDALYTIDLDVNVRRPDLVVTKAEARLVRYTTYRCPLAEPFAPKAVGQALGSGLERFIKDEIGKLGCRHMAQLFMDMVQAVARTEFARFHQAQTKENPERTPVETRAAFFEQYPDLKDFVRLT